MWKFSGLLLTRTFGLIVLLAGTRFASSATLEELQKYVLDHPAEATAKVNRQWKDYQKLYRSNFFMCGSSRLIAKNGAGGGNAGHAVMFLKNVCLDKSVTTPRLRMCSASEIAAGGSNLGTGVSVNRLLKNANWVGIPGWKLFMYGGIDEKQALTKGVAEDLVNRIVDEGYYRGIKIYNPQKSGRELEVQLATEGLGSDYAYNFGRTVYCVSFPASPEMIERGVQYLNGLNDFYARRENYRWDMKKNNCSHLVHNAMAAMGIWKGRKVNSLTIPFELTNLSVPSNDVLDAVLLVKKRKPDPLRSYERAPERLIVRKYHRVPSTEGVLLNVIPYHYFRNDLYDSDALLQPMDIPLLMRGNSTKHREVLEDPVYTDLATNLRYFLDVYRDLDANRPSPNDYLLKWVPFSPRRQLILRLPTYHKFYDDYFDALRNRIEFVEGALRDL